MRYSIITASAVAIFSHGALSATQITDQDMTSILNSNALPLALSYSPIWFFGQSQNIPPCLPTWAFSGSETQPDIYDIAHKTKPAPRCPYPHVGCVCRNPGVPIGNRAPQFPVYYSYKRCGNDEVRIAYNLFYEKDGACVGGVGTKPQRCELGDEGHDFDWERVIVIISKDSNNMWAPSRLLGSYHGEYLQWKWANVQNTNTPAQAFGILNGTTDPRKTFGQKNQDHPMVFVAWAKHPHFDDRNTHFNDLLSQSSRNAFRSDDWWVWPQFYIQADGSTAAGQAIKNTSWGAADSIPPVIHDKLCTLCNGPGSCDPKFVMSNEEEGLQKVLAQNVEL